SLCGALLLMLLCHGALHAQTYTLSLHDALPISFIFEPGFGRDRIAAFVPGPGSEDRIDVSALGYTSLAEILAVSQQSGANVLIRSEEHTSELQSRENLVCRLLLDSNKRKLQAAV